MKLRFLFYFFLIEIIFSCKTIDSKYNIAGEYKLKDYSKIDYFVNGLLYAKNHYVNYALFNELSLKADETFDYIACIKAPGEKGHYKVKSNSGDLFFETGALKGEHVNFKIRKNQLFKIQKGDSITTIYNLTKFK